MTLVHVLESDWWPHFCSVAAKVLYCVAPDPCGLGTRLAWYLNTWYLNRSCDPMSVVATSPNRTWVRSSPLTWTIARATFTVHYSIHCHLPGKALCIMISLVASPTYKGLQHDSITRQTTHLSLTQLFFSHHLLYSVFLLSVNTTKCNLIWL